MARDKNVRHNGNRLLVRCAILAAVGIVLFVVESYIPRPLPWAKPGLANIVTLLAIYIFGLRATMVIVLVRICAGSLLLGQIFSPSFILSLSGGLAAALVMASARSSTGKTFSIVGVSIFGALAHNFTQLFMAYLLIVKSPQIFFLTPLLIIPAVFTGLAIGLIALFILQKAASYGLIQPKWYGP
jgi:heptaprenyl diphosphate synthase